MTTILETIAQYKWEEIRSAKSHRSLSELQSQIAELDSPKGFKAALVAASRQGFGLIAEMKKASPSKGAIVDHFDPVEIAKSYFEGGAHCISVLTDRPSFHGSLNHLQQVAAATPLPCLRKDFMLDPYQVWEARAFGADCILIIMAMVSDTQASELESAAFECGLDCLVEVHHEGELQRATERLKSRLIGINNRDLTTFEVSIETTCKLLPHIPADTTLVAESGLKGRAELDQLARRGARCFLIGESLMRSHDRVDTIKGLLRPPFLEAD